MFSINYAWKKRKPYKIKKYLPHIIMLNLTIIIALESFLKIMPLFEFFLLYTFQIFIL